MVRQRSQGSGCFYTATFSARSDSAPGRQESRVKNITTLQDTPSGSVDVVTIELAGEELILMSAGPYFKFTPAVSFLIACNTPEEVDDLWGELSKRGSPLMELGEYPFSKRYGWVQDQWGVNWQVMFMDVLPPKQKIIPTLMFVGDVCGKAEEAIKFYTSLFQDTEVGHILRWGRGEGPNQEGTIKHAGFTLEGQEFAAMDSAHEHNFTFNEAISFMVRCDTQEEIDDYWEQLSADPKAEQCGWLKDRYGLSWQIVPTVLNQMLSDTDKMRRTRVTEAFLKMKKFDIEELRRVYQGGRLE
jgi:predicted 3-demethylubiquinone-9 3-methyltransferase (glyoxalase superfamily)